MVSEDHKELIPCKIYGPIHLPIPMKSDNHWWAAANWAVIQCQKSQIWAVHLDHKNEATYLFWDAVIIGPQFLLMYAMDLCRFCIKPSTWDWSMDHGFTCKKDCAICSWDQSKWLPYCKHIQLRWKQMTAILQTFSIETRTSDCHNASIFSWDQNKWLPYCKHFQLRPEQVTAIL